LEGRVAFTWTNTLSFADILKHAAALPPRSAIFWELMIVDAIGVVHQGDQPLAQLHAVANAPIFSFDDSFFGSDLVGGPMHSVSEVSQRTADVAIRVLRGERPDAIKTQPIGFAAPKYDWREIRRWRISESRLPPGSTVYFRELTVWEKYRIQLAGICAALLLQAALTTWLIYEHWRRQRAEAESRQRVNELARMNRFATAGEMSASIAHEIRQPLAAISFSGAAGLNWLRKPVPDFKEIQSALQTVVDESHRADEVIKGVRAMFGRESTTRSEVNLNELVRQVIALARESIHSHNIVLQMGFADDSLTVVMADPIQLQQVILNLILNAIEAMSSSDHWARILRIETGVDEDNAVFLTVEDSGPGFDKKVADNLFTPFVTTKSNGMGMGLSICKTIIEKHEGRLTAAFASPRGAALRIVLPRGERADLLVKESETSLPSRYRAQS
jgi:C4-dicarboxylate-specific signal transduction histidine kinase